MNITIAAATRFEIREELLLTAKHNVQFLYTGVGILSSAVSLTQHVFQQKPELIIQAGIAGAFYKERRLGEVVVVIKECVGDMGVKENESWNDLFDFGFLQPNKMPYENRFLPNADIEEYNVRKLELSRGVTVNQITTDKEMINTLKTLYFGDVESMEGASLHYVCRLHKVPFIQVRGLSNYVGERDKKNWKIIEAIENVNEEVKKMLELL